MTDDFEIDEFGDVEDGDLLAAAIDAERNITTSGSLADATKKISTAATPSKLYLLKFGKHRGKSLDEVPKGYIDWIIERKIHQEDPALKAALLEHGFIGDESSSSIDVSTSSRQPYRLNFGRHEGKTLKEVPIDYIRYLTGQKAHEDRLDLRGALTELAYSMDESEENKRQESSAGIHRDRRFFDWFSGEELWITSRDAYNFFKVTDHEIRNARVPPRGRGRWNLFEVYCFVRLRTSPQSANLALKKFLEKNSDREEEIFVELGLVCCCDPHAND